MATQNDQALEVLKQIITGNLTPNQIKEKAAAVLTPYPKLRFEGPGLPLYHDGAVGVMWFTTKMLSAASFIGSPAFYLINNDNQPINAGSSQGPVKITRE